MPSGTLIMRATTPDHAHVVELVRARLLDARAPSRRPSPASGCRRARRSRASSSAPARPRAGISVSGNATLSRSGRTGSASGSPAARRPRPGRRSPTGTWMVMAPRSARAARDWSGAASGISTCSTPSVVRGARLVRDDVGAELDHPPERAVLDLDLLVEAAAGLGGAALAGDHELAPADLEADVGRCRPPRGPPSPPRAAGCPCSRRRPAARSRGRAGRARARRRRRTARRSHGAFARSSRTDRARKSLRPRLDPTPASDRRRPRPRGRPRRGRRRRRPPRRAPSPRRARPRCG